MLARDVKKFLLGVFTLAAMLLVLPLGHALAASGPTISMTTSPVLISEQIHPGTSKTSSLQIMNNGASPVAITMRVDKFTAYGKKGQAAIHRPAVEDPSPSWVSFSKPTFVALPGVWTSVKMTITLPPSAELGYYYAVVFSPSISVKSEIQNTNIIKGSNAILVLVNTASQNEKYQLNLANFSSSHHVYNYLPAVFSVEVANRGNIYAAPSGNIYISRTKNFTHPLAVLSFNPAGGNVLPNSERVFTASWASGFPAYQDKLIDGQPVLGTNGQPKQSLSWNFSKLGQFRFGRYYAKAVLVYNNGVRDVAQTQIISFWVIPWLIILIIAVIVILLAAGAWTIGRRVSRVRHIITKPRKKSEK